MTDQKANTTGFAAAFLNSLDADRQAFCYTLVEVTFGNEPENRALPMTQGLPGWLEATRGLLEWLR